MTTPAKKRQRLKKDFDDAKKDPGQSPKQRRESRRQRKREMTKFDRRQNKVTGMFDVDEADIF